jgi:hypothetical protein
MARFYNKNNFIDKKRASLCTRYNAGVGAVDFRRLRIGSRNTKKEKSVKAETSLLSKMCI